MDNLIWYILPVVNPDGYEYSRLYVSVKLKKKKSTVDGTKWLFCRIECGGKIAIPMAGSLVKAARVSILTAISTFSGLVRTTFDSIEIDCYQ